MLLFAISSFILCLLIAEARRTPCNKSNLDISHEAVTKNANYIFNAIHSSMRTWGSTLNHNGMSFFPATIPAGVKLYHGQPDSSNNEPVEGMDWLAFESSFAYMYTGMAIQCPCLDYCEEKASSSPPPHDKSWPHENEQQQPMASHPTILHAKSHCPPIDYIPGHLQTYTTTRPLNLLYIDGVSGGKSSLGTLDTQDLILLNYTSPPSNFSDFTRAKALCSLAQSEWEGRIDGFIRLMFGFEVILCEFDGAVELTDSVRAQRTGFGMPYVEKEVGWMSVFGVYKGIEEQFWGVGGGRVEVDREGMVSVFAVEGVDLWVDGREEQPRLMRMEQDQKDEVMEILKDVILKPKTVGSREMDQEDITKTDWQAISDVMISRYAEQLYGYAYGGESYFSTPALLSTNLNLQIRRFIDYDHRNIAQEVTRCANQFIPSSYRPSIAAIAVLEVSRQICCTLFEAESILSESKTHVQISSSTSQTHNRDSLENFQILFRNLLRKLAWPIHRYCRGCKPAEACFTAAFPFGKRQDLETPSCKGFRDVAELYDGEYWLLKVE